MKVPIKSSTDEQYQHLATDRELHGGEEVDKNNKSNVNSK